ncbi:MAG: PorP/SprF family type IX secretion system membrane protein [Bacteroidales bacterium]|nr:PorP/SprF family type IX secretion system membrane protein [Bacteroidales bacterium]
MGKLKSFFFILVLIFGPIISFGQDIHFSTFNANPMILNPANTAFGSSMFRVGTIYRNQWSTVSNGYNSYLLSFEVMPYKNRVRRDGIGLGINFMADVAGSLNYGQQNIGLSLSYFKALDINRDHYISFGFIGNTSSWGYNLSNSIFGRYPQDNEGILLNNIRTYDFGLGAHWQINANGTHYLQAGTSLLHLNQPNLSYYENSDIFLPIKFNLYVSDLIIINFDHSITPSLFFQKQRKYNEFVFGLDYNINVSQTSINQQILSIGTYYRTLDAIIVMAKYKKNDIGFGISYDINISRLTPASKSYGAVEIWLLYSFNPYGYKRSKTSIPCPTF